MKFSCERCQTRYSIGDEKVKGKVLKIRCKTCGNIIVVREQIPTVQGEASGFAVPQQREAAMAAVGGAASSAAVASAPSSSTNPSVSIPPQHQQQQTNPAQRPAAAAVDYDWYVAIKGKQHGPAKAADIVRLFKDGKITDRTYLWHDQLPAWTRLKDLPEFAGIVAEGPAPKRPPPPPPSEDGAELINFEQARAQRQGQSGMAPSQNLGPVTNDPFAAIQGSPGVGGDNAPRESTRVFIMQAGLHNRAKKQKLYAGIAVVAVLSFVLLCVVDYQLDILGLKNVVNAVAVSTGIKEAPEPANEWGDDTGGDPTLRCKLMPDPDKCVREAKKTIAKKRIAKAKAEGKSVSDADLKDAFGGGDGSGSGVVARGGGIDENGVFVPGTGPSSDEIKKALSSGGKGGPTGPRATVDTPSVAGTTIDADNASKVVRDGQPAIQTCVDEAMKRNEDLPGKVRMTVAINTKGAVDVAKFNDAVINASGLGSCITKAAKRWKFAPPTEAADLEIPLVLR